MAKFTLPTFNIEKFSTEKVNSIDVNSLKYDPNTISQIIDGKRTFVTSDTTVPEEISLAKYELHEFDPEKVFTGEINTLEVNSFKYEAYNLNTVGQIVIDKNNPIDGKRKFVSLVTKKTSQSKFNQVIDIDFAEFILKNNGVALDFLRSQINALESDKASLKSGRDTDRQKIDALNKQIAALQAQILAMQTTPELTNKIPNALSLYGILKVGPEVNGLPTDRIMSKNRKYVAVIQGDRNLVVYKGEFDERGYALENTVMEPIWTPKDAYLPRSGNFILKFYPEGLAIFQTLQVQGNQGNIPRASPGSLTNNTVADWLWLYENKGKLANDAKLILEESGRLSVTSQSIRQWNT
jgi:hypothetical protein